MDLEKIQKGTREYYQARALMYKLIFNLSKIPVVKNQCCNDDPTFKSDEGSASCTRGMIESAQKELDEGNPVVFELFGRRKIDADYITSYGEFYMVDTATVYVPGQKINKEFFKKMMDQEPFDATPPEEKLSDEEKKRRVANSPLGRDLKKP